MTITPEEEKLVYLSSQGSREGEGWYITIKKRRSREDEELALIYLGSSEEEGASWYRYVGNKKKFFLKQVSSYHHPPWVRPLDINQIVPEYVVLFSCTDL